MSGATTTFVYSGSPVAFVVPDSCIGLLVECWGAQGGTAAGAQPGGVGGLGGYAKCTIPVTPGETIWVYVGGHVPNGEAGWNGGGYGQTSVDGNLMGGGGGGASDVRRGGTALANRKVIAGGGGGGGFSGSIAPNGGAGGGTNGVAGDESAVGDHAGAGGGSQSAGGAAGGGAAGTLGVGATYLAGGGGGLYGGGALQSGGGGGSGYVNPADSGATMSTGVRSGNGQVNLTPAFIAPATPTLTSPITGSFVDMTNGVDYVGTYNANDTYNCSAVALRVKSSGAYQYWNVATAAFSSSLVWNPCDVAPGEPVTVTLPAGTLSNGTTYTWSQAHQEGGELLNGAFATDALVVGRIAPVVTVTGRTGTVTDTDMPTVTWTDVLAPTVSQNAWQAVWETGTYGAVPGFGTVLASSNGVNVGTLSATCPVHLANTLAYRQFVQVTQTGGQQSKWDHADFTLTLVTPEIPSLSAIPSTYPRSGMPGVLLTISGHDVGAPWTNLNTIFTVQYSDDGIVWQNVRYGDALTPDSSDQALIMDVEGALGSVRSYRARATGTAGINTVSSDWTPTASSSPTEITDATIPATVIGTVGTVTEVAGGAVAVAGAAGQAAKYAWTADPLDPGTALQLAIRNDDPGAADITQDVTFTLGATAPVISSDVRQVYVGTTTWLALNTAQRTAFEVLLSSGRTLMLRFPPETYDEFSEPGEVRYFTPNGKIAKARVAQASLAYRDMTSAWVLADRP